MKCDYLSPEVFMPKWWQFCTSLPVVGYDRYRQFMVTDGPLSIKSKERPFLWKNPRSLPEPKVWERHLLVSVEQFLVAVIQCSAQYQPHQADQLQVKNVGTVLPTIAFTTSVQK